MSDLNLCQFIGRLGNDPETRQLQTGDTMTHISIAVSEKWRDNQGNPQEKAEWVSIVAFGKLAEIMAQYLKKGAQVYIAGSLHTRKWTDNQGIERYSTEIRANQMQMLGSKQQGQQQSAPRQGYQGGNGGQYPQTQAPQHPQQGQQGQYQAPAPHYPPQGQGVPNDDMPF